MKTALHYSCQQVIVWSVFFWGFNSYSEAFTPDLPKHIPGIWKLQIASSVKNGRAVVEVKDPDCDSSSICSNESPSKQVLLKFQDDGSFRQCDEGHQEGRWISGRWHVESQSPPQDASTILRLAMDRQYFGPPHDMLLTGEFDNDEEDYEEKLSDTTTKKDKAIQAKEGAVDPTTELSVSGALKTGRFVVPNKDPSFFEEPIINRETSSGSFQLKQMLSFHGREGQHNDAYQQSDFNGRKFYITFVPAKNFQATLNAVNANPSDGEPDYSAGTKAKRVDFFTDTSLSVSTDEGIFGGHFEIEDQDQLCFQVTTSASARNYVAPGEMLSYKGRILRDNNKLSVRGAVIYYLEGKPNEVGTFLLLEDSDSSTTISIGDQEIDDDAFQ